MLATLLAGAILAPLVAPAALPLTKRVPGYGWNADNSFNVKSSSTPFATTDGGYDFYYQTDGNLVVYQNGQALWNSNTGGRACGEGGCNLIFQYDGNFVMHDNTKSPSQAYWSTGTNSFSCHSIPAAGLFFRNSDPFIQLYSHDPALEWQSHGFNQVMKNNPDTSCLDKDHPSPSPPPCHGAAACDICCQQPDGTCTSTPPAPDDPDPNDPDPTDPDPTDPDPTEPDPTDPGEDPGQDPGDPFSSGGGDPASCKRRHRRSRVYSLRPRGAAEAMNRISGPVGPRCLVSPEDGE